MPAREGARMMLPDGPEGRPARRVRFDGSAMRASEPAAEPPCCSRGAVRSRDIHLEDPSRGAPHRLRHLELRPVADVGEAHQVGAAAGAPRCGRPCARPTRDRGRPTGSGAGRRSSRARRPSDRGGAGGRGCTGSGDGRCDGRRAGAPPATARAAPSAVGWWIGAKVRRQARAEGLLGEQLAELRTLHRIEEDRAGPAGAVQLRVEAAVQEDDARHLDPRRPSARRASSSCATDTP